MSHKANKRKAILSVFMRDRMSQQSDGLYSFQEPESGENHWASENCRKPRRKLRSVFTRKAQ